MNMSLIHFKEYYLVCDKLTGEMQGLEKKVVRNLLNEIFHQKNCDMKFHPGTSCSPSATVHHEGILVLSFIDE